MGGCSIFQSTLPMRGATIDYTVKEEVDDISIHTPHAGSDIIWHRVQEHISRFQSTLPMRGATTCCPHRSLESVNFNPHSPCGERRRTSRSFLQLMEFQSTLPMRGATRPSEYLD